jgi:cyclohexanone monooxygenase
VYGVFVVATVNAPDVMTDYLSSCTPGYYNGEGQAGTSEGFLQGHFSGGGVAFYELLREWREQGDMDGLILK